MRRCKLFWFEKAECYTLISIDCILNQNPLFYSIRLRILDTNGIAGLYDQNLFEVFMQVISFLDLIMTVVLS